MALSPGARLGPYEICALVGAGGMGEVYDAYDPRLRRHVALKILPARVAADPGYRARFEREAQAVAALSHPNIVTIHSVEEADGVPYLTMELVSGRPLTEMIPSGGLPLDRLLQIGIPLADAIAAAHARGITHRDLKPANILLTDDGRVKVLDFGLAKMPDVADGGAGATMATRGVTAAWQVVGTAAYMSPEQAEGKPVDHRTDLFAFGIVLYELATGERPFHGDSPASVISAILRDTPPAITDRRPELPDELAHLIQWCLEKDPTRRLASAADAARALDAVKVSPSTGGINATGASMVSPPTIAVRWRRPIAVAAVAIILLSAWLVWRSRPITAPAPIDSIAVLPFQNVAGNPDADYLSEGVTDTLTNALAGVRALRVAPRTLAAKYRYQAVDPRQAGRDLNVRAIVMGRVEQHGDRLRIQADLIDVESVAQIWGEQFDRPLTGLTTLQADISRTIVAKLRVTVTDDDHQTFSATARQDPVAYQLYLKGRHEFSKRSADGMARATGYFEQAIARDPSYALAHVQLARSYGARSFYRYLPLDDGYPKAIAAARKALTLDDALADAHGSLGSTALLYSWDWAESERRYRRAIALDANNPDVLYAYGYFFLRSLRRTDDALTALRRAETLDPLSPSIPSALATIFIDARRYDEAHAAIARAFALVPDFVPAHESAARAFRLNGQSDRAIAESRRSMDLGAVTGLAALAESYGLAGRRAEALAMVDNLGVQARQTRGRAFGLASLFVGLGNTNVAMEWLERAYAEHDVNLIFLNALPELDRLRPDPRFASLIQRVGIPPQ